MSILEFNVFVSEKCPGETAAAIEFDCAAKVAYSFGVVSTERVVVPWSFYFGFLVCIYVGGGNGCYGGGDHRNINNLSLPITMQDSGRYLSILSHLCASKDNLGLSLRTYSTFAYSSHLSSRYGFLLNTVSNILAQSSYSENCYG